MDILEYQGMRLHISYIYVVGDMRTFVMIGWDTRIDFKFLEEMEGLLRHYMKRYIKRKFP